MNIIEITIDQFTLLTAEQHQVAIAHYDEQIAALVPDQTPVAQRELTMYYELRRLHQERQAELLTELPILYPQAA